ncbi:MAG TPA: cache domain-containing protein, partial [Anaerolineae bacterium]|nr:cache domain-containing protein [Anaerolineae bacterium]
MVQLRSSFFPSTGEPVSQQRVAFRMIATLCAATAIVDAVYFFLAFRLQQPQMFALAWVTLFFFGVTFAGTWLVRSGQLGGAAWLISGAMAIIWPLITGLWVSDIGLILSVSPALMTLALAQMMPRKQVPWAVALGVIASIVTILLDMFGQPGRLFVSELQILIAVTVALIVLAYGYFFTQGFADYPLRIKLILAFLVVTIVAVGVVDAVTDLTIRTILNRDTTENLQTLADAQARLIGDILTNEVETLQVMTHNDIIHQALDQGDFAAYDSTNLAAIQKLLSDLDEQWQQVDEQDPLVRSRLDSAAAAELTDLQRSSANNAEVFITDQYGAVVAATGKTSDFNQADEQWWQAAYNEGRGGVYIGLPEFDESSQTFGVNLALPIYDDADPVRVAGVLRSTYSFAGLTNLLLTIKGEQADQITARLDTDLLIEDQIWHLDDDRFEPIASETLAAILATETQGVGEFEFEGVMSLVGQSFIRINLTNSRPASLNWRVLTYVEREATLGPIRDQRQNILLVGLGVLLATTVIAVGVARLLADPIT